VFHKHVKSELAWVDGKSVPVQCQTVLREKETSH
jgi:hypothetical protein